MMKFFKIILAGGLFVSCSLRADNLQGIVNPDQVLENQYTLYQPQLFDQEGDDQQVSLLEFLWLMTDSPVEGEVVGEVDPVTHESHVSNNYLNLSEDSEGMLVILVENPVVEFTDVENLPVNTRRVFLGNGIKEEGSLHYRFSLVDMIDGLDLFKDTIKETPGDLLHDVRVSVAHILEKLSTHEMVIPPVRGKALSVFQKE